MKEKITPQPHSVDEPEAIRFSEQVAALAYALWEARGAPEGTPEKDWYQAERVLVRNDTGIL